MYEYFVEKQANDKGEHIVHKDCCGSLPAQEALRWLGVRSTTAVPVKEANDWFPNSVPCPECMAT